MKNLDLDWIWMMPEVMNAGGLNKKCPCHKGSNDGGDNILTSG